MSSNIRYVAADLKPDFLPRTLAPHPRSGMRVYDIPPEELPRMAIAWQTLDIRKRQKWRTWLRRHHASSPGVWLTFHRDHTGVESLPYEDSVREALCFGWVDSLIKRLDDDRYARKFTPRQPTSKWSESNRKRWIELKACGLLTAAGLATAPTDKSYAQRPAIPGLPAYIAKALQATPVACRFFQELPPGHRRHLSACLHSSLRPETRTKRICESVALLAAGKKLGLK